MSRGIATWEDDGGASSGILDTALSGTAAQVEWAERIRQRVDAEFDRVATAFRTIARKQGERARADTEAIIAILEEKRAAVMAREQAGYFIHEWQEIGDQVRQMIFLDPRYQAIKENRLHAKPGGS